jgi:hypothetical protein
MRAAGDRVKLVADRARSSEVRRIVITRTSKRREKGAFRRIRNPQICLVSSGDTEGRLGLTELASFTSEYE